MKKLVALCAAVLLLFSLAGCDWGDDTDSDKRKAAQKQASTTTGDTQEIKNLKEKKRREENPSTVRYLYVVSFGKPMGYYMTKGKISSNGSQMGPELESMSDCSGSASCEHVVLDSAQDDGSYGDGDPGIFFFTTDGTMVVLIGFQTMQSDQPLPFDVPQLRK